MIWRFADCELDEERYELRRRGRLAKLEPRAFDVLLHLLRHRERVVPKAELLAALWPGTSLSDSVLPRCITAARRALGDGPKRARVIQTVHGRGYRFVANAEAAEARPAAAAEARASGPAFVGRADALAALRGALEQSAAGRGRVALIVGEPGIGKTRTLEELGEQARRRGMRWLAGRCWESEGAPPFWPFREVLRAFAPHGAERGLAAEGEVFSTLGASEGEQARFRWFESVARELRRAATQAPLLLSVDDLHWADHDSLRLFLFLARELRDAPLLLVGTYRDVEVRRGHALARVLGDLAREPQVARVTLRGLAAGEIAALAQSVAGAKLEAALAQALAELTEGNPFFVQEMARWLRDRGGLGAGGALALTLPQGVRDAVGRRLDGLSAAANALLRAADVIGREFSARVLAEASGALRTLEPLSEAAEAGVVLADPETPGRFSFAHALVRQTLYEELPVAQRVALHRRVAEVLARSAATPAAELAHHYFEALPSGTADAAVRACRAAAEQAHERLAYAESARQYERALEALGHAQPDEARRALLLIALGEERWTDGDREKGRAALAEAAELARRIGRVDLFARAAIGYRGFGELGMPPDAKTLALLEEARDALGDRHPILRSRILARLAGTLPYAATMAERERLASDAWRLAEGSDDRGALVDAIGARYWATLGPDRIDARLAVSRDALALAERYADRRLALLGHEIAIAHGLLVGDLAAADREIAAYERLGDEIRQPVFRFLAGLIRGSRALGAGAFDEAEAWIREARARGSCSPKSRPAPRAQLERRPKASRFREVRRAGRTSRNPQGGIGTAGARADRLSSTPGGEAMQALSLAAPPAPRPFEARRSLRLVRSLIDDPEQTELVFELIDAVGGRGDEELFQAFAASEAGRALLAEQPELVTVLGDRAALVRLPAESFGRAYLAFAEARDFAADGLQQVSDRSVIGELNASLDPERRWFYRRITAMHDLWHVLTGYATDEPGETALLAFSLGQGLGGRGFRLLLAAAVCKGSFAGAFAFQRGLAAAWRRGRQSAPLAQARYEELLPLPLEAVRQSLRIPLPRAST